MEGTHKAPKRRVRLKHFSPGGIPVGVNIDPGGYIIAATAGRFVSYHKVLASYGDFSSVMFAKHTIGSYRSREKQRDEGPIFMSADFFAAHRTAVERYVRSLPLSWCERLLGLGRDNWVPDRMFEARETGRIVLQYGRHLFFFQRRGLRGRGKERKDPTKYVHFTLDSRPSLKATRGLRVSLEEMEKIKHWPNAWAEFFADVWTPQTPLKKAVT